MTKYRVVALDLDGTVLNTKHELSEKTKTVLKRLSDKGVIILIATGRSPPCITKYFEQLGLSQATWPGVSYNGACGSIWSSEVSANGSRAKEIVFLDHHTTESASKVIAFAKEMGAVAQYYNPVLGEAFAVPTTDEHRVLLKRYADLVSRPQILVSNYSEAIELSPAAKVLILSDDAEMIVSEARKRFSVDDFNIFIGSPDPYFIEFLRPDVSKGSGLVQLLAHLKVDVSEVVAFGDGANDQEMLKFAGLGVAMKNASPTAKAAADVVLEWSNDEDGVALQLERMESEGCFYNTLCV